MGNKNLACEQAICWLYSMRNDKDLFNSINAENALALIEKLQKDARSMGQRIGLLIKDRDRLRDALDEARKKVEPVDPYAEELYGWDQPVIEEMRLR